MGRDHSTQRKVDSALRRRTTRASEVIREMLVTAERPVSVQEVFDRGRKSFPSLGIATVYRWIRRFLDDGVLREVHLPDLGTRYEYITSEHHHYFHCCGCGHLFVLTGCTGPLESMVPEGFVMESHEIILRGHCADCARAGTPVRDTAPQNPDCPERQ